MCPKTKPESGQRTLSLAGLFSAKVYNLQLLRRASARVEFATKPPQLSSICIVQQFNVAGKFFVLRIRQSSLQFAIAAANFTYI